MRHYFTRIGLEPLELKTGETFTIGRDATCSLSVADSKVSRLHAEVRWVGGRPVLVDVGSHNGTFVGGRPIQEHPLVTGDEIQVGPLVLTYHYTDKASLAREAIFDRASKTVPANAGLLTGTIEGEGLAETLQSIELTNRTGTLGVYSPELHAWMTFHDGVPGAAEATPTERAAAKSALQDEAAAWKLLELEQGRFVLEPDLKVPDRRMKMTVTAILLEWSRRARKR